MNNPQKKVSIVVGMLCVLLVVSSCNTSPQSSKEPPSTNTFETISLDEETADANKKFLEIWKSADISSEESYSKAAEKLAGMKISLRQMDDTKKVYGSDHLIRFAKDVKAGTPSAATICTLENETFQTDFLSYDGKKILLTEKTIFNNAKNDAEQTQLSKVSTHEEIIDTLEINSTGFLTLIHIEEVKNIYTSFSYKIYDDDEICSITESYFNQYIAPISDNPMLNQSWETPQKATPDSFVMFVQDYYNHLGKNLSDVFKTNLSSPLMEAIIPFDDLAKIVTANFATDDVDFIKTSSFFHKDKNAFFFPSARGGGGMVLEPERIALKNGTDSSNIEILSIMVNVKNADTKAFAFSFSLNLKRHNDDTYRYFSNTVSK